MPSGPKKRKSKRKNKASLSPPHQGWLRSHIQMLKAPSFGNGTKGKEKHNLGEKEAEGRMDMKEEEEKVSFLFKGVEAAAAGEMNASGSDGSYVSAVSNAGVQSEADNSQNLDDLKMLVLDNANGELQETNYSGHAVSNGIPEHSVASGIKVARNGGLEEKTTDDDDKKEAELDSSFGKASSSQESSVPLIEVLDNGVVVGKMSTVLEANASSCEKEEKLKDDAGVPMEAPQNDETDAITPKTEIPHPLMVVGRASAWNCCGLLEVLGSSQH